MHIYKYPLRSDITVISVHKNSRVLSAGFQPHDSLVLWVLQDGNQPKIERLHVLTVPTGNGLTDDLKSAIFVSTVQFPDGIVEHVFYSRQ